MNHQQGNQRQNKPDKQSKSMGLLLWVMAALSGGMAAYYAILYWLPTLSASIVGQEQHFFWFLSRATAIVAYLLLWLNMTLGVGITSKLANIFPGGSVSSGLHQYLSILGLGFAAVHGLLLLGDRYLNYSLIQVLLPFGSLIYRPMWVGLGQISLYLWLFVYLSVFVKKHIGKRTWRFVHYFSFLVFLGVMVHGIMSGTDSSTLWMNGIYWSTGSIFGTALIYRIITRRNHIPSPVGKISEYPLPETGE